MVAKGTPRNIFRRKLGYFFLALSVAIALEGDMNGEQATASVADNSAQVLIHLNMVISWYNLTTKIPPGDEPSDAIYLSNATSLAAQVVRLAFQSATSQAILQSQGAAPSASGAAAVGGESTIAKYTNYEAEIAARIDDDKAQIAALQSKPGRAHTARQQRSLEGKLGLDQATLEAVQQMKQFAERTASEGKGLLGSINELARSVPAVFENTATANNSKVTSNSPAAPVVSPKPASTSGSSGLFQQLIMLYQQMQSIRSIDQRMAEADNIAKLVNNLRSPLRDELSNTVQQGTALGQQKGISKEQYDVLTQRFKQISAALLPLSEELLLLQQSRSNLRELKRVHADESRSVLISILSRVLLILLSVGLIFALAELWQHLTFRYVHDPKRRRQFMTLRRFVMAFLIFLVLLLGFASEFSSLATFAGFVTAGIAVGLQTVLLSVVAYFFVIGRYGISVGDRVSVAGVTGDVIDVGLVRFYLLEYAAAGAELYPTGRIVVFSNAVLFQATTPFFKQLPGTRYVWHEVAVPVAPHGDHSLVRKALDDAVRPVYAEHVLGDKARQGLLGEEYPLGIYPTKPEYRLHFIESGVELVARYPVDLNRAVEVDERIAQALLVAIRQNEALAKVVAGTPKIRTAVK